MQTIQIKLRSLHSAQAQIKREAKRFNVLRCGRRFGKTALAEELVIDPALDGLPVAYYAPTYKDLDNFWKSVKRIVAPITKSKNEQLKQIELITGGIIDMWSLEDPDSGRGRFYKRVVIDECEKAKKLEEAWNGTIRATLTDLKGDAWFLSTPKFGHTFFKELHKLHQDPTYSHEWMGWVFTTYDNPTIDPKEIDAARATLEHNYFLCEYMAADVDLNLNQWAFAYSAKAHTGEPEWNPKQLTFLSFDFNVNPMCCSVIQHYSNAIHVLETIKLPNSGTEQMCEVIQARYPKATFMVTGDASGRNRTAAMSDSVHNYTIIQRKLRLSDKQFRVPKANPSIEDNKVLVNSILQNYKVIIHREKAKSLHFDMQNVKVSADNSILKTDRKDPTQQADAMDTFRYWCNAFMANFIQQ